jgi:hypothetical protein
MINNPIPLPSIMLTLEDIEDRDFRPLTSDL